MSYNASPTFFTNLTADTARQAETNIAKASWESGGCAGASNAHGLGIDIAGGALPLETGANGIGMNWTKADQFNATRTPQVSQVIGGSGFVARTGNVATTWDTTQALYTVEGAASSGGVSGNGSTDSPALAISTATNPADVNGAPVPKGFPTIDGSATLSTLEAGWVTVA